MKIREEHMTERELAVKLYNELEEKQDVQKIVDAIKFVEINNTSLTVKEQLEVVDLIRKIYFEKNKGLFEDVSAFLALVDQVETQIRARDSSKTKETNDANK